MSPISSPLTPAMAPRKTSGLVKFARRLKREPGLLCGLAVMALLLVVVVAPGLFTAQSPYTINIDDALQPPSDAHLFGTDDTGRDVFARVIYGARVTLLICAGSLLIAALIGGLVGALSGFFGGWVDQILGRIVDVVLSFPPIILGVIITGVLGPATSNLILALSIIHIPMFFRIARSGALGEAGKTYVEAARCVGLNEITVLYRHVLRNVLPLVLVQYMVLFPLVLQIQAALGFLGLGVQPPTPDWGAILQQGKDTILLAPWISLFPGIAVLITAFALMLTGRALQRSSDRR
ncbi:ABC transporter permease [Chelatococcus asaccharovorans]|uniref:ABC transporter permease n=1 Tax=Chelatococcus asaccharovorans TaxID=28210 RepID=UPI00224C65A4|nr:ABC transporter permease [Chelatococcus asaccharovorans]CAH1653972.1 Peptide/nickel transport system permease protein [Chelatococcus asaccharovorans]CAH1694429.1 Peptide/nickel transport system permease protein [Chelatococcus asaccharovorans]